LGFPVEALQHGRILGDAGGDRFERNQAVDDGITSAVNHAHGTVAQLSKDFIFGELFQYALRLGQRAVVRYKSSVLAGAGGKSSRTMGQCIRLNSTPPPGLD